MKYKVLRYNTVNGFIPSFMTSGRTVPLDNFIHIKYLMLSFNITLFYVKCLMPVAKRQSVC